MLKAEELSVGYHPDQPLLRNVNLELKRGDRVALLGPNGTGKSTLLKTLAGQLEPLSGEIHLGTKVSVDMYDQEQAALKGQNTVLEEVWAAHPTMDQTQVRTYLGQFLFSDDEVFKKVSSLSGGEKARLSLLKRLLNRGNLLLMDEPTNHLDTDSKERLEEGLDSFSGTLLFVSHDRYFINRLANRIWEVHGGGIRVFEGNYEAYREERRKAAAPSDAPAPTRSPFRDRNRQKRAQEREQRNLRREATRLEEEIRSLEEEKIRLQEELCQEEIYSNPEESIPRQRRLDELEGTIQEKTERWLEIAE